MPTIELKLEIERLRAKLLDLSLRNPLLNYRSSSRRTLKIVNQLPDVVYERLVDREQGLFITPLVDDEGDLADEASQGEASESIKVKPFQLELPTEPTDTGNNIAQTNLSRKRLESTVRAIQRDAEGGISETGLNYLYLALGFLGWNDHDSDELKLAPLILIPVQIEKSVDSNDGQYRYSLVWTGDEVAHNICLEKKLEELSLQFPRWNDSNTPEEYWATVKNVVRRNPKWEIRREACVGFFSFHKLSMYADIDPAKWNGSSELSEGSLVDRLICGGANAGQAVFAPDYDIDQDHTAQNINLVQDADSSQHSALCDIASQKNLVIEGPPGTGKSQTITNAIAHAIASGRSVLFVSEKLAALEVVYSRLERLGLSPFCLELHSHQAVPKNVLESLKTRLEMTVSPPQAIDTARRRVEAAKEEIRRYLDATSKPVGPANEPLYSLLWRVVELRGRGIKSFRTAQFNLDIDDLAFDRAASTLRQFTQALLEVPDAANSPWWGFFPDRLNPNDISPVECHLQTLRLRAISIADNFGKLVSAVGGTENEWRHRITRIDADLFTRLANSVPAIDLVSLKLLRVPALYEKTMALREKVIAHSHLHRILAPAVIGDPVSIESTAGVFWSVLTRELAHLPATSVLPQWNSYRAWLATTISAVKQLQSMIATLSQCGFGGPRTITEISKVRTLVGLSQHPLVEQCLPDKCLYFDAAKLAVNAGKARAAELLDKKKSLEQSFRLDLAPDRSQLLKIITHLRKRFRSPIRLMFSEYRSAKRALFQFAKKEKTQAMGAWIADLDKLNFFLGDVEAFGQDPRISGPINPYFNGLETDWSRLTELLNWVRTAKSQGLDYEASCHLAAARKRLPISCSYGAIGHAIQAYSGQWNSGSAQFAGVQFDHVSRLPLSELHQYLSRLNNALLTAEQSAKMIRTGDSLSLAKLKDYCEQIGEISSLHRQINDRDGVGAAISHHLYQATIADPQSIVASFQWISQICEAGLDEQTLESCLNSNTQEKLLVIAECSRQIHSDLLSWQQDRAALEEFGSIEPNWFQYEIENVTGLTHIGEDSIQALLDNTNQLPAWASLSRALWACDRYGVRDFAIACVRGFVDSTTLAEVYELTLLERIAETEIRKSGVDRDFSGNSLDALRHNFSQRDKELLDLNRQEVIAKAHDRIPPDGNNRGRVSEFTELSLINNEIRKTRRFVPIRDLIKRAGMAIQALKPCFLMSPLSVSSFLPAETIRFDLVIMDEASQIKPEDALGTILRAKQLVVVGDPKQLPPTSFFDRMEDELNDDDATAFDNAESVLEVAAKSFRPYRRLRWHYRSKHHSLIQFSSRNFYDDDLVFFPSPTGSHGNVGIRNHFVDDGQTQSGANVNEAKAVVEGIIAHAMSGGAESLGVGTFNKAQATLIEELLDVRCDEDALTRNQVEKLRNSDEPLFIKNLENLQGDERDVIFISYTYGKDPTSGRVMQRFGPINQDNGWRRLNVLVTRSRKRMEVFSSLKPSDILGGPDKSRGVIAYRDFLEFAITGTIPDRGVITNAGPDSPFEVAVSRAIQDLGLETVPQVGVVGYSIDIGVREPGKSDFLLGVECDGATYHSSRSARDRDRLREDIIRSRGWKIHRIWSTDWFLNQRAEVEKLRIAILKIMKGGV